MNFLYVSFYFFSLNIWNIRFLEFRMKATELHLVFTFFNILKCSKYLFNPKCSLKINFFFFFLRSHGKMKKAMN